MRKTRFITPLSITAFTIILIQILMAVAISPPRVFADREPPDGPTKQEDPASVTQGLVIEDLTESLTPSDLASLLIGTGVAISNVTYTGAEIAAGSFTGGDGIIGFESGIILTSGAAKNVIGPNVLDAVTGDNQLDGDGDLDSLAGYPTYDATILGFDFVPAADTVFFRFVFTSDEYNEYVNSPYNDVFGFFINGQNCATVEGDAISVNLINFGNPFGSTPNSHPELYINNDLQDGGGSINTEMDGLTKVLTCSASVTPNQTNTMKLAIADASDHVLDSAVFIEGASLVGSQVLELVGIEVTQAIQNWENGSNVPIIKDKPTFVRAHVKSNSGTIYNVTAELYGKRDGVSLPGSPLKPKNKGLQLDIKEVPSRFTLNDSFYFQLPETWLNGKLELEFKGISHSIACKDHAGTDDDCKVEFTFQDTPSLDVRLVGLVWEEDKTEHEPLWSDMLQVVDELEAIYPIPDLDYDWPYSIKPLFFPGAPTSAADWIRMNTMLLENRLFDCATGNCPTYYLGIAVDPPPPPYVAGLGGFPNSSIAGAYITKRFTPSHELGHALGRKHTKCSGDEAGADTSYPYSGGKISDAQSGDAAFYGFNIKNQAIYGPSSGDLMSYCSTRWPSDWTYRHLRDKILETMVLSGSLEGTTTVQTVLVSGIINQEEGTAELSNVIPLESNIAPSIPAPGSYLLRFETETGGIIASYSFQPTALFDDGAVESYLNFGLLLPWTEDIDRVILLENGEILDIRSASDNPPSVSITSPNGAEVWSGTKALVEWVASDPDADPLSMVIQYSRDGGAAWITLDSGISGNQYEVDLRQLPGSNNALLRVIASDGFLSDMDVSDAKFTLESHAPNVNISAPQGGSLFVGDQMLTLEGAAYDAEDGILKGGNLEWLSDLNGLLGSGDTLSVLASQLDEGIHTITLEAEDSEGKTAFTTVTVVISLNRPTLAPELEVSPAADSFAVLQGSGMTEWKNLAIRNIGDGTISWSATSGESWIVINDSEGFTPSDTSYAIDPTGLASGSYSSTITIEGVEASNSPQVIEITLMVFEPVKADFTADPVSGRAPLSVKFTNTSLGDFTNSFWEFGDGKTSTLRNPLHTYDKPGIYTVKLVVDGGGGMGIQTKESLIVVEDYTTYLPLVD